MKKSQIIILFSFLIFTFSCKNKTYDPRKKETTPQTLIISTDTILSTKSEIKPFEKKYYNFFKQVLKENITIIDRPIKNTSIDSIILSDLISIAKKKKIQGNRYNYYFKIHDTIKHENLRDQIETTVKLSLNDVKIIYDQRNKTTTKNIDFNIIGYKTISQSEISKKNQSGPFCLLQLPIFSNDKQYAIMKYEYIPFPGEYSSGTFLFKKNKNIWKPIGSVGYMDIS
ncbi:hypothetical protein Q4595_15885 [Wenyingzhuangia sp. 1_MG-2023]|nr:hypothetical protein [Wenyingzhuangia sp. 1_MG-2023]